MIIYLVLSIIICLVVYLATCFDMLKCIIDDPYGNKWQSILCYAANCFDMLKGLFDDPYWNKWQSTISMIDYSILSIMICLFAYAATCFDMPKWLIDEP